MLLTPAKLHSPLIKFLSLRSLCAMTLMGSQSESVEEDGSEISNFTWAGGNFGEWQ